MSAFSHEATTFHDTGLQIQGELPFEQWERIGAQLGQILRNAPWAIGDWLLYGEARYGEAYAQGIESTGLEYSTLANYKWVARSISMEQRREELSFSHHALVAGLEETPRASWLVKAIDQGWTVGELRQALLEAQRSQTAESTSEASASPGATANAQETASGPLERLKLDFMALSVRNKGLFRLWLHNHVDGA